MSANVKLGSLFYMENVATAAAWNMHTLCYSPYMYEYSYTGVAYSLLIYSGFALVNNSKTDLKSLATNYI